MVPPGRPFRLPSTAELTAGWLFANPFCAAGAARLCKESRNSMLVVFCQRAEWLEFFLSVPPSLQHREVCGKEVAPHCLAD